MRFHPKVSIAFFRKSAGLYVCGHMNYVKSGAVSMEPKGPEHVNVTTPRHRYGRYLLRSTVGKVQPELRGAAP